MAASKRRSSWWGDALLLAVSMLVSLAVAAYAAGGRQAMLDYGQREGGAALLLTRQMR